MSAGTTRLISIDEMARKIGFKPASLHHLVVRQRLEAKGCPKPRMTRPLSWSEKEVDRWIDPVITAENDKPEATDSKDAWRKRLETAYGEARS